MTKITKAQAIEAAKAVIAAAPNTVNPNTRVDGRIRCLYHTGRGASIKRCIAGQIGWNLGLPTPDANDGSVADLTAEGGVWEGLLTPAAVDYLLALQQSADGDYYRQPRAWGDIPRHVVTDRS